MASSSTRFGPTNSRIVRLLRGKESGSTNEEDFKFIRDIPQLYNHTPQTLVSNFSISTGTEKRYFFTQLEQGNEDPEIQVSNGGYWRRRQPNDIEGGVARETRETFYCYYQSPTETTQWRMKQYMLLESEHPNEQQWALCVVYKDGE